MKHKYLKNVVSLSLDVEKCNGCSRCIEVCPHVVFDVIDGKARIIDRDVCMECGACALNCAAQAITVNPGVGCAAAFIFGWLTGKEPACGCSETEGACCG